MKIKITTKTKESPERVFEYFKKFCIENLQEFALEIEGSDVKYKQ